MPKKLTTEDFIERARAVHGDRYGYDDVVYVSNKTKVKITCYEHGVFEQTPNIHLNDHGCPKCGNLSIAKSLTKTAEQCITDFKTIHGDLYDYSDVVYVNNKTNVSITCKDHGVFKQTPHGHMSGKGCPKCGNLSRGKYLAKTTDQSIADFKSVHGNRYGYDDVVYVNAHTKVNITCYEHGVFEQTPSTHLMGHGCPKCNSRGGYNNMTTTELRMIRPAYVYIVRLIGDDGEVFDKIGVTKFPPHKRFKQFAHYIPIGAECREFENMEVALNKEAELHSKFNLVQYTPKHYFGGSSQECFEPLPFKFRDEDSDNWLSGVTP